MIQLATLAWRRRKSATGNDDFDDLYFVDVFNVVDYYYFVEDLYNVDVFGVVDDFGVFEIFLEREKN